MIYIYLILSFLLEAICTNIFSLDSLFIPLFTLTALVIIYPCFNNKVFNFIITSVILGLVYDIAFSSSIFINTIVFGISSALIILLYNYVNFSIYSSILFNIVIIIFYRLVSYLILCVIEYLNFNQSLLFKGIYSSLIINILYGIVSYILLYCILNKYKNNNF